VHCFVGYWIAFLHYLRPDLGRSGVGFAIMGGKQGLIEVPPFPPYSVLMSVWSILA